MGLGGYSLSQEYVTHYADLYNCIVRRKLDVSIGFEAGESAEAKEE